ncbi:hypothetical protein IMZ68_06840, partial [Candidatus Bathyarchaeota archaeon]|nr:hypothetical protein [Candidatus Bathyarchaeota archaeon]
GTFSPAILNAGTIDSISPGSSYAEKYPKGDVGAVIFQKASPGLLSEGHNSSFAVKETIAELWEMLK